MRLFILKLFLFFTSIFLWSCSDDDNKITDSDGESAYALFLKNNIEVSSTGGVVIAIVEWSQTEWEISLGSGDIVANVTPMSGGSMELTEQSTRLKITCTGNDTHEPRSQTVYITNKITGEKSDLLIKQDVAFQTLTLQIDPSERYQQVVGFGGMYNPKIWCGGFLITMEQMSKMYGVNGLGYSILRLMIYPDETDWSADVEAAKMAQDNGAIIFACPWDCTDALSDKVMVDGEEVKHLRTENYEDYADHLIRYIRFMKQNGIDLYAISVQNEPDMDFTFWTPQEVVTFVEQYGRKIRAEGVRLMSPESCGTSPEYTDPILNDVDAFANTDILAGHLYQGFINIDKPGYERNRYEYICSLYPRLNGKTWWMTEHLFNDGEKEDDPEKWQFRTWEYCFSHLAKEIHMCMEGYCSAYVYWYLKRFYGMMGDNDERSPVREGEIAKNGYILSHYARYATNTTRIKAVADSPNVYVTAYINAAGNEIALVLLNMTDTTQKIEFPLAGIKQIHAVETNAYKNMEVIEANSLAKNGSAYVMLSGYSIASVKLTL